MKLTSLFVMAAAANQHPQPTYTTSVYPNGHPASGFGAASQTCPVKCEFDGSKIRVEHLLDHPKMDPWIGSLPGGIVPGSATNKVFHRCFHRMAGSESQEYLGQGGKSKNARECMCQCAQWSYGTCAANRGESCPTQCGLAASTIPGTASSECKFRRLELARSQCLTGDLDTSCQFNCPATQACCQDDTVLADFGSFNGRGSTRVGCEGNANKLRDTKKSDCRWTSPKMPVTDPRFESLKVRFDLKGKSLESRGRWRDIARIRVRTCRPNGNCGAWRIASTITGNPNGRNNRFQTFTVDVDHSQILRNGDTEVQGDVKLHNDGRNNWLNRERHIFDNFEILGMCN